MECVCIKTYKSLKGNFYKGEKYSFKYSQIFLSYKVFIENNYIIFSVSKVGTLSIIPFFYEHFEILTDIRKRKLNKLL